MGERLDRRQLIAQIQAGDRRVFKELYLRYFDRVHTYMNLMLEDEDEAHAATQTAFRMALAELPGYRFENGAFEGWLCRFVRRAARGRVGVRGGSVAQAEASPASDHDTDGIADPGPDLRTISDGDIVGLIQQLPPRERELVILHYMFGLNPAELAVVVEREVDEIGARHQRALDRLGSMLSLRTASSPPA
jgi:DNA-directed RNA polymerase specialized sigma24 family protein